MPIPAVRSMSLEDQATQFLAGHGYVERPLKPLWSAGLVPELEVLANGSRRDARVVARRMRVRLR